MKAFNQGTYHPRRPRNCDGNGPGPSSAQALNSNVATVSAECSLAESLTVAAGPATVKLHAAGAQWHYQWPAHPS